MYVSGESQSYLGRTNQLAVSGSDLNKFEIEGYNYTGYASPYASTLYKQQRIFQRTANAVLHSGFNYSQLFTGINYF